MSRAPPNLDDESEHALAGFWDAYVDGGRRGVRHALDHRREAWQALRAVRRLVRERRAAHFEDVPSAAFRMRRACVPATVSLIPIRSHAPARTSSNVRGGYGSML